MKTLMRFGDEVEGADGFERSGGALSLWLEIEKGP